jgi:hypothetical protein
VNLVAEIIALVWAFVAGGVERSARAEEARLERR